MTNKHTPGPWSWINSNRAEGRAGRLFGNGDLVTEQRTKDDFIYTSKANARLIAASPELLEALINAAEFLQNIEALQTAHTAIAKATGGTDDETA